MHGRVKTISTEEQKLKQKKAREVKLQLFLTAMSRIFDKRERAEYDDEALTLTRDVLLGNPDIITLWNLRREIFQFKNGREKGEITEKMVKDELFLTEQCLRVNPKSYGTWHHRVWILDNLPHCNWVNEIEICNRYLALDERNFHCWDYRKTVAERSKILPLDEYNFTTQKIEINFSNYSAWHFRSKLLPQIFEDPEGRFPVAEDKHKTELELVQSAAFTDPDDQSAWFYQRWLLGLRNPAVSIICAQVTPKDILVCLTRDVRLDINRIEVKINGCIATGDWKALNGKISSSLWIFQFLQELSSEEPVSLTLYSSSDNTPLDTLLVVQSDPVMRPTTFSPQYSEALKDTLREQLQSCQELLELEPNSKWTLLTCVWLMKSLDLAFYSSPIKIALHSLSQIDPLRSGYYADLASQVYIELELISNSFYHSFQMVDSNLTSLYRMQYLVLTQIIDFRGNKLKDANLVHLYPLINCRQLMLDSNLIERLQFLPILKNLEILSLKNNPLVDIEKDRKLLQSFPKLQSIILA